MVNESNKKTQAAWEGFKPVGYTLNFRELRKLPVTEVNPDNTEVDVSNTNARDVLLSITNGLTNVDSHFDRLDLVISSCKRTFVASSFTLKLLDILLNLRLSGIDDFNCVWYIFDKDWVVDDLHSRYTFFLVSNNKIVDGTYSIHERTDNGFTHHIFSPNIDAEKRVWSNDRAYEEAVNRYWYKRFYSETFAGQITTLRSDNPAIYDDTRTEEDSKSNTFEVIGNAIYLNLAELISSNKSLNEKIHKLQISIYVLIVLSIFATGALWAG